MENISRRGFLKTMGTATAGVLLTGTAANAAEQMAGLADKKKKKKEVVPDNPKVKLACVGIANRGRQIINDFMRTGLCEIVALCDVDLQSKESQQTIAEHPDAKVFTDFREMFDKAGNTFEAVTVAIPDFSHFPVCMLAISEGKHVYVEKPMARTFLEIELMMDIARRHPEVVTQVGNQGHSEANYFQFKAWKEAGIIKDVYAIDAHFNDWRRWYPYDTNIQRYPEAEPLPAGMDWDKWLTTARYHDYNGKYHPGNWRGWYDFGLGVLGDWGAHILDTCHEFLELGLPYQIEPLKVTGYNDFFFPKETTLRFKFPSRGSMPPVDVTWYDGEQNLPPLPEGFGEHSVVNNDVPATNQTGQHAPAKLSPGKVIYSRELTFKGGTHGATLEIIPKEKAAEMADKLPEVPKSPSNHFANFLLACQGKEKTRSPFHIFGPMAQMFSLGIIAIRTQSTITFDSVKKEIVGNPFGNALLAGELPRKGWEEFYKL